MQTRLKDDLLLIRLFPDENFYPSLEKACRDHRVKTAVVLCGIGQLKNFELGYFKEKGNYTPQHFEKPHELLCLEGNITLLEQEHKFHIHAT
ncbi:MAG: PCC domain-containing protein, partial [Spirochaetota bacterium]